MTPRRASPSSIDSRSAAAIRGRCSTRSSTPSAPGSWRRRRPAAPTVAPRLAAVARRLVAIDPDRAGIGGLRLQLELALFAARPAPCAPAPIGSRPAAEPAAPTAPGQRPEPVGHGPTEPPDRPTVDPDPTADGPSLDRHRDAGRGRQDRPDRAADRGAGRRPRSERAAAADRRDADAGPPTSRVDAARGRQRPHATPPSRTARAAAPSRRPPTRPAAPTPARRSRRRTGPTCRSTGSSPPGRPSSRCSAASRSSSR